MIDGWCVWGACAECLCVLVLWVVLCAGVHVQGVVGGGRGVQGRSAAESMGQVSTHTCIRRFD